MTKEDIRNLTEEIFEELSSIESIIDVLEDLNPEVITIDEHGDLFIRIGGMMGASAAILWNMYCDAMKADNFISIDMGTEDNNVTVTVQRHNGITPTRHIEALQAEVEKLRTENKVLQGLVS